MKMELKRELVLHLMRTRGIKIKTTGITVILKLITDYTDATFATIQKITNYFIITIKALYFINLAASSLREFIV